MKLRLTILNRTIDLDILNHRLNQEIIKKISIAGGFQFRTLQYPNTIPTEPKKIKELWRKLKQAYHYFHEATGTTKEALNIPKRFDYTNYWTNKLHRVFTNALTHHTYYDEPFKMNNFILRCIHQINDRVHDLEMYIDNYQTNRWRSIPVQWCEIIPNNLDKHTLIAIEEFKDMISDDYDIYILKHITGKDFITAYFNDDTSNSWDVNNGEITYAGLCIDYQDDFKRIWRDDHFLEWVRKHNYQGNIGYIPIGNICPTQKKSLREVIWWAYHNKKNNIPCKLEIIE